MSAMQIATPYSSSEGAFAGDWDARRRVSMRGKEGQVGGVKLQGCCQRSASDSNTLAHPGGRITSLRLTCSLDAVGSIQ